MATIVNNPGNSDSGAAGWAVAAIVIVAVALIALFVWPGFVRVGGGATNVNVTVPAIDNVGAGVGTGGEAVGGEAAAQ